jgi:hypothetical protein
MILIEFTCIIAAYKHSNTESIKQRVVHLQNSILSFNCVIKDETPVRMTWKEKEDLIWGDLVYIAMH